MKKTLVAMAVMAVAGAASAQATLYGKIDIGWEYLDAAGVQTNKVGTGQFSGSRWGVRALKTSAVAWVSFTNSKAASNLTLV